MKSVLIIPFADIDFENYLGKGKRNRKRTERYVPEENVKSLSKEIKSRNQKKYDIITLVKSEEIESQTIGSKQIIDLEIKLGCDD